MNNTFSDYLSDLIISSNQYNKSVIDLSGENTPIVINGLSEEYQKYYVLSLCRYITGQNKNVLVLFSDSSIMNEYNLFLSNNDISPDIFPYRDFNFSDSYSTLKFEQERIKVLFDISRSGACVLSEVTAASQLTVPLDVLDNNTVVLNNSDSININELTEKLDFIGYKKSELVEAPGQYSVRGGIIDIFSVNSLSYRVELFGDEIDRMGLFDPYSQRFTDGSIKEIIIPPAREILLSSQKKEHLITLLNNEIIAEKNNPDKKHLVLSLKKEVQALQEEIRLNCIDKYLPLIYDNKSSLVDNFNGTIIVINQSMINKSLESAEKSLLNRIEDYIYSGCYFPDSPNLIYLKDFGNLLASVNKNKSVYIDLFDRNYNFRINSSISFQTRNIPGYDKNYSILKEDLLNYRKNGFLSLICCESESECRMLCDQLFSDGIICNYLSSFEGFNSNSGCFAFVGSISNGFEINDKKTVILKFSSFQRYKKKKKKINKDRVGSITSYADLNEGDYVVHEGYGIGKYLGIRELTVAGITKDYIEIKYAGNDTLFLPTEQLEYVSKYIGKDSDSSVKLSKMGGTEWHKTKNKAKESTKEMAKELVDLYRKRKTSKGFSFAPDDQMSLEFSSYFEYEETEGQLNAINDVSSDMEQPYPMDRLVCGDVGYGKTEVALRAAFKAVNSGMQVAVLVPTTILAYQHYKTFSDRMSHFPVSVDYISRFKTNKEINNSVNNVKEGKTDIIIGTHRLLSDDISFKKLGLIIVDEEQRFGVKQKEKLKQLSSFADVLTLTATPIPRTLNMAMGGIVDMSLLEEAPGDRYPVQTYVLEHDDGIINDAIRKELDRNGQVFYLYNRVESIYSVASKLKTFHPDAVIEVAHGRMDHDRLEEIWTRIINNEIDILVCTTIIETGIDIPNANTLIIENADKYGLSQLHQIRGRIGRSQRRAYAYLTYKKNKELSEISEKRLRAIKEFAEFGAGIKIALRDLEIRGAGNLLGAEQHGHIESVGFDLYMKLLNESVSEEKGDLIPVKIECKIEIDIDAYIPQNYISDTPQRIELYKKIAMISSEDDYDDIIEELCDRFGEPGREVINICKISFIRHLANDINITKISYHSGNIILDIGENHGELINFILNNNFKCKMFMKEKSVIIESVNEYRTLDILLDFLKKLQNTVDKG